MLPSSQSGVGRWTWKSMARLVTGRPPSPLLCDRCQPWPVPLEPTPDGERAPMNSSTQTTATGERADLPATLAKAGYFVRITVRHPTDGQHQQRSKATKLSMG